jgi:hypothetical protein
MWLEYKENEYDAKYATHVWKHYSNHFIYSKKHFRKIYDDFKTGLGSNATATVATNPIKDDNFNIFIKAFRVQLPSGTCTVKLLTTNGEIIFPISKRKYYQTLYT